MSVPANAAPSTTHSPAADGPSPRRPDLEALAAVRRHYPDAVPTDDAVHALLDVLARECGLAPSRILLADAVCSDDVNAIEYPERARAMLGPFHLGGLDGFPHAGPTGMGAFAAHAPADGGIVIYHAPHIGVSRDGTLGAIRRVGQHAPSACCGAARAALSRLQAGALTPAAPMAPLDALDHQQVVIEQLLLRDGARILSAAEPLKEATEVMAEAIAARIDLLVARTRFPVRWLVRFGGILVNGDADMGSFSVARRVVLNDLAAGTERDLHPLVTTDA